MSSTNRDSSVASVTRTGTDDKMKVARPDFFYGDRYKLDDWLNQILLYFQLEGVKEEKRPLTAASYLRGEAQQWIRPRLTDKLLRNQDTEGIFGDLRSFILKIRSIYGLSNDQQVAIRQIQHVTQKASASQYTAKFSEYASKTGWDDNALRTMYYRGLKDHVKDELMRYGADQSTLSNLTKAAIEVDDKLYERSMEKRHNHQGYGRSGYATNGWSGGQQRRDPDAMEIDNTQKYPRNQGRGGGQRKGSHQAQGKKREGLKCYNCQKTGHYARDCRGRKVQPQQRKAEMQPYEVNVMTKTENEPPIGTTRDAYDTSTGQNQHAILHWMACYEDSCTTHWSYKNGSGYFPSQPRKHRRELNVIEKQGTLWDSIMYPDSTDDDVSVLRLSSPHQDRDDGNIARGRSPPPLKWEDATLQETQEDSSEEEGNHEESNQLIPEHQPVTMTGTEDLGVIPEIDNSDATNESTPEDSEEEYSDDDAPGDNEILHFSVEGPEPIRRMVLHLARRFEEMFPDIQGKRRLHPYELDQTLAQLRAMFWSYRQISEESESHAYVRESVPIGSTFNPAGGYITPDGIHISRQMRERVKVLGQRYKEIERMQIQWHDDEITESEMRRRYTTHMPQWSIPPLMPAHGPQPIWIGSIFQHVRVTTRGLVSTIQTNGRATLRPKDGPLSWEVCLEDMGTPSHQSKN